MFNGCAPQTTSTMYWSVLYLTARTLSGTAAVCGQPYIGAPGTAMIRELLMRHSRGHSDSTCDTRNMAC